ncbi:MAG: PQQ-binding-like beta-propeller repeat protein [Bacillota bacterium]
MNTPHLIIRLFAYLVTSCLAYPLYAADTSWPQWRGPRGDGHSSETNLPLRWSPTDNIAWKTPIPGKGHSSPIVFADRLFLTTCVEEKKERKLLCLSRLDGKLLWERTVFTASLEGKHSLNNFASATPATDGSRVFVAFLQSPNIQLVCYDFDGNELWRRSPGKFRSMHGWASSPILYKDLVILNCDQDAPAFIVAYERATGIERWRIDRPNRIRSYCNPLIVEAAGKMQMVLTGSRCTASYDPDTGKQHWIIDGPTEQFVASPVYTDGTFFITGGFPTFHILGIRPDGTGDVTNTHVLWHHTQGASYVPSPIAFDKYFVVVSDEGLATCLEAKTGKALWSHRLGQHHRPSPVYADGRLYFLADNGDTFVLQASLTFQLLATNSLHEDCYASPAISHGQLFIRTTTTLYCIGK